MSWSVSASGCGSSAGRRAEPERPRRRRSSRFSPWAAASAASSRASSARWWRLSSVSWAVSARTTLLCEGGGSTSGSRGAGGVRCWSVRSCSMRARSGERYRKSIDTPAVFARPRKVIGSPAADQRVERGLGALGCGLALALRGGAQVVRVPACHQSSAGSRCWCWRSPRGLPRRGRQGWVSARRWWDRTRRGRRGLRSGCRVAGSPAHCRPVPRATPPRSRRPRRLHGRRPVALRYDRRGVVADRRARLARRPRQRRTRGSAAPSRGRALGGLVGGAGAGAGAAHSLVGVLGELRVGEHGDDLSPAPAAR